MAALQEPGIVVLTDNRPGATLVGEWGLSILVAAGGQRWLWDTGQTGLFLDNARRLGLDLSELDGLALSHGHYDHVGGLASLLDIGFSGPVVAHESMLLRRFSITAEEHREIGVSPEIQALLYARLRTAEGSFELAPNLRFVTDIPRRPGAFQAIDGFFLDPHGREADGVPDDAFLLLDTPRGAVVVLGCCHSGMANSLLHAADMADGSRIHAVVGGMHLFEASGHALEEAASVLEHLDVEVIAPGHCTGGSAVAILEERFPGRVLPLHSGMTLTFT